MNLPLHVYQTILLACVGGFITGMFIKSFSVFFEASGEQDVRGNAPSIVRSGIVWGLLFGLSVFPLFSGDAIGLIKLGPGYQRALF